jgi:hypothetical protein
MSLLACDRDGYEEIGIPPNSIYANIDSALQLHLNLQLHTVFTEKREPCLSSIWNFIASSLGLVMFQDRIKVPPLVDTINAKHVS